MRTEITRLYRGIMTLACDQSNSPSVRVHFGSGPEKGTGLLSRRLG